MISLLLGVGADSFRLKPNDEPVLEQPCSNIEEAGVHRSQPRPFLGSLRLGRMANVGQVATNPTLA